LKKYVALGLIIAVLLSTMSLWLQPYGGTDFDFNAGVEVLAKPNVKLKFKVKLFEGTITAITDTAITVEAEEFSGNLIAIGKWIYVYEGVIGIAEWARVKNYVEEGRALIAMASITKGNKTLDVLLGLKQENLVLVRPILIRYYTEKHYHTKAYIGIYGKIVSKGGNFLLIENKGIRGLVVVDAESTWYKAGYGLVTWKDVADEFKVGDLIRIFCHNVLILKEEFAERFGFNAVIWGYSGAIIDLTSGTAISRYIEKGE